MSQSEQSPAPAGKIRSVGVIGGGTSGYFAAIALKKRFPELEVTLVESKSIPIIGVGEATTTRGEPPLDPDDYRVIPFSLGLFPPLTINNIEKRRKVINRGAINLILGRAQTGIAAFGN